jgi:hypothetical protein
VTISGAATENQTLTASNTLADADGLGGITYHWLRGGVDTGATGTTYTLGDADVGAQISVKASYTDSHGTAESVTSAATAAVADVNDAPTGTVTISGAATENQTLTASNTLADADGLGPITYHWLRGGVDTGATGSTYTLGDADVGAQISVRVNYTDLHGTAESVASAATAAVANVNDAPTNLSLSSNQAPDNVPGATVGVLSVDDPDAGDMLTFTIQPGLDSSLFTIAGDQLRVGNVGLDLESATRSVTVRAADSHGEFVEQTFTIHVFDGKEFTLTAGADVLLPYSSNTRVIGTAPTLNAADNLDGGDGFDSLVLFGGGTFDLNGLAGFANFEEVQVVNFSVTPVTLTLRDGTTSDVAIGGSAFTTQINLFGTTSAGSILGGDGTDSVSLSGNASATSINLGNGNNRSVLSDDAIAGSILGGNGTDSVSLSGNASATTINLGNGNNQSVTLSDDAIAGSILGGNGRDNVNLFGNASATTINLGNAATAGPASTQSIGLFDAASATIILGGIGSESVQLSSSGSANVTTINLGDNFDFVSVANASAWNPGIAIDGGSGSDSLALSGSNQTYDLQLTTLTGIETLSLNGDNETVLVDGDALTGVTNISGGITNKIVTGEAALDLTGKTVSGVTVENSTATGTTFTVDSKTTAFQVLGGPGADTLETTSFAFTALEREAIFALSIETIVDTEGTFNSDPNAVLLTDGTDILALTADNNTVNGTAVTLNATGRFHPGPVFGGNAQEGDGGVETSFARPWVRNHHSDLSMANS